MVSSNFFGNVVDAFSPRNTPADLWLVYLWTILSTISIFLPVISESPVRVALALPMILFIPGYVLIAALFPGTGEIDGLERIALSFGLSIAIVPLIGLALNYTPWGIRLEPVLVSLVAFTLVMAAAAQVRRFLLPEEERFSVPFRELLARARGEMFPEGGTRSDRILSALLLLAIIAAVSATIYVIAVPKEGEKFTEFYILGNEGRAADYPTDLLAGKNGSVIIGVVNHEYRTVPYVVELHLVNQYFDPVTNATSFRAMEKVAEFPLTLAHNATYQERQSFIVNSTEYNQLKFLLFIDEAPPDEVEGLSRINASYRDLHLWIRVREPRGR